MRIKKLRDKIAIFKKAVVLFIFNEFTFLSEWRIWTKVRTQIDKQLEIQQNKCKYKYKDGI